MFYRNLIVGFFLTVSGFCSLVDSADPPARDYALDRFYKIEEGLKVAREEEKTALVMFLGSSWCPWSKKFCEEILRKQSVLDGLQDFVVIVEDLDENLNPELKSRFQLQELPLFILVDSKGEIFSRFGYFPWIPSTFVDYLKSKLTDYHHVVHALSQKENAEEDWESVYRSAKTLGWEEKKQEIIQKALKTSKSPFFFIEKYAQGLKATKRTSPEMQSLKSKIISLDPNNKEGALLKLALLDFQNLSQKKGKKVEKVIAPLLEYLHFFGKKDTENAWQIERMVAEYLFNRNRVKEAIDHIQVSHELAPNDRKLEVLESMEYMKTGEDSLKLSSETK